MGSFSNWQDGATQMERDGTGWWATETLVPPGEHEFSYLVDGELWMPDYAACGIRRNHSGNWISLLTVQEPGVLAESDRPAGAAAQPRGARADRDADQGRVAIRPGAGDALFNTEGPSAPRRSGADAPGR